MADLRETIEAGAALYRALEAQLVQELPVLAGRDPHAIAAANDRQEALLGEITRWEEGVARMLDVPAADGHGVATLTRLVTALPEGERPAARNALAGLKAAADAARHQASVSHIVVERGLEAVHRTIDVLTGSRTDTTYGREGGVARGARRALVERAG